MEEWMAERVAMTMDQPESNVDYLRRCWVCDQTFVGSGGCCSRECRMAMAEFAEFSVLGFILNNFGPGAPSQEELREEYYRQQLQEAIMRLPTNEDRLFGILGEIIEDLAEAGEGAFPEFANS
jgi:hypothetical protein